MKRDLHGESHPISIQLPPDLPSVDVDPARIEVVFRNLLDNAIRYTPRRKLEETEDHRHLFTEPRFRYRLEAQSDG
ncbi:hypothetical protein [Thermoflexus sp.]|uniref:hypothetical protein n=1 Tax=Thermoflexus sp. TaxID=1969742 RepID=UPI0035E446D8